MDAVHDLGHNGAYPCRMVDVRQIEFSETQLPFLLKRGILVPLAL